MDGLHVRFVERVLEGLTAGRDAIDGMRSVSALSLRTVPLRRR